MLLRVLLAVCLAVGWAGLGTVTADAAAPAVTLSVLPTELGLAPGEPGPVTVIVTNAGPGSVSDVVLRWRTESALVAAPGVVRVGTLAAGSAHASDFTLTFGQFSARDTAAVVVAEFRDDTTGAPGVLAASVAVTPPAQPAATSSLTAQLSTAVTELQQYRSTDLILTLTNGGGTARTVSEVALAVPSFVRVSYLGHELSGHDGGSAGGSAGGLVRATVGRTLQRGEQLVLTFGVTIDGPLQPGAASVVAEVVSAPASGAAPSTVVATTTLTFAVLGESAFLTAVGAPSLLLVPGLVFAVVVWLLRRRVPVGAVAAKPFGIEEKVVFWVLAAPLGIVLTFAYGPLSGLFGQRRSLLTAYGLDDILYVWLLAALLGVLAWALWWVLPALLRRLWRWWRVPGPGDPPMVVLTKLSRRRHHSLRRLRATWTDADGAHQVRVLSRAGDQSLVASPILYSPEHRAIAKAIEDGDARAAAKAVRKAGAAVHLRYGGTAPVLVPGSAVTAASQELSVIEFDPTASR